jgi:glycosyltransferase involved in cell wall biosynthesis
MAATIDNKRLAPAPASPSVIFILNSATRSGAPITLLHFMRWFRAATHGEFSCLLNHGGELQQAFSELCPTSILQNGFWSERRLSRQVLSKVGLEDLGRRLQVGSVLHRQISQPDLIYCNTVAPLPALEAAASLGGRILCHVHELEFSFQAGEGGPVSSQKVLSLCDRFIACSGAVANNLVERHAIARDRIDVVHESIDTTLASGYQKAASRRWIREKLGLAPDAFIVGAAGALEWRKGTDLFVQLAAILRKMQPKFKMHFVWLGGNSDLEGAKFMHDVELANLAGEVTLIPSQPDPMRYFSGFDLFALASREDPFPLVCLEAAACGCPILCFDRAGGMPEFVERDCGMVVPYLDLEAMASAILRYQADPEFRLRCGRAAQNKVRERHDVAIAAPQILEIMRRTAALGSRAGGVVLDR